MFPSRRYLRKVDMFTEITVLYLCLCISEDDNSIPEFSNTLHFADLNKFLSFLNSVPNNLVPFARHVFE